NRQRGRVGRFRGRHGHRVGVGAVESEVLPIPLGSVAVQVATPGQLDGPLPGGKAGLHGPVRGHRMLAASDHAEPQGYWPSTDRAPVSTTSKSEPLTPDRLSSPFSRRPGAIDMRQSLPLSATNMP